MGQKEGGGRGGGGYFLTYGDQVLDLLGGAKVGQLDKSGVVNQDVGTLDVAVHHTLAAGQEEGSYGGRGLGGGHPGAARKAFEFEMLKHTIWTCESHLYEV